MLSEQPSKVRGNKKGDSEGKGQGRDPADSEGEGRKVWQDWVTAPDCAGEEHQGARCVGVGGFLGHAAALNAGG